MRTVAEVDKVVVLKDGVVAEMGRPSELIEQQGIYKHMLETQKLAASWQL